MTVPTGNHHALELLGLPQHHSVVCTICDQDGGASDSDTSRVVQLVVLCSLSVATSNRQSCRFTADIPHYYPSIFAVHHINGRPIKPRHNPVREVELVGVASFPVAAGDHRPLCVAFSPPDNSVIVGIRNKNCFSSVSNVYPAGVAQHALTVSAPSDSAPSDSAALFPADFPRHDSMAFSIDHEEHFLLRRSRNIAEEGKYYSNTAPARRRTADGCHCD